MKKFFISFFFVFLLSFNILVLGVQLVFATDDARPLEVSYPEINESKPETVATPTPEYVKYIFNFVIWISGIVALGVLIYAGFLYFTSTGDPGKMQDAKDRIFSALLGLVILFGSWLILTTINPQLITFNLPRLIPIISELTPGVLLCKDNVNAERAWQLTKTYNWPWETPLTREQRKAIKKELDSIFKDISTKCYWVYKSGDILQDFIGRVKMVYFIPRLDWEKRTSGCVTIYGAVLYEKSNYEGNSQPVYNHIVRSDAKCDLASVSTNLKPSSIKPFETIFNPDPKGKVTLYEKPNRNAGIPPEEVKPPAVYPCGNSWRCGPFNLSWSPESIEVEGNILAILQKENGESDIFPKGVDNNLLDNLNIINWVRCNWYSILKNCAEAAAKKLIIINGKID